MDPELARRVARACRRVTYPTELVAIRAGVDPSEAESILENLERDGFVVHSLREWNGQSQIEWTTTVRGGALASASFLKPITRKKAQTLLAGVLQRAQAYNDDPVKPMWIESVALFGSLLDDEATEFGDIDIHVKLTDRPSDDPAQAPLDYARASGRTFSSFFEELSWTQTEVRRILKNRSGYISIHTEDISQFTDRWQVLYERQA